MKYLFHFFIVILLTLTTQIGGFFYLISILLINKRKSKYRIKRFLFFTLIYIASTFFFVPKIAPLFGRVKINDIYRIEAHSLITKICNRNYVNPNLNSVLKDVSLRINKEYPEIKLVYLDANFPFYDGFPLLPHLSHNDGKKIDISFIYEDKNRHINNLKPSRSGYGVFEKPIKGEYNQTKICREKGYWQYDSTKYFSFGKMNPKLKLSEKATKFLIQEILNQKKVSKLFIEPHLKKRLKLKHSKIRFHGCKAVRHDDHIHFQIH